MSETAVIIFVLCKILLNFILLYLLIVFLIYIVYCIAVIFFSSSNFISFPITLYFIQFVFDYGTQLTALPVRH